MGLKNTDFEYIQQGKIQKIIIQNTRDNGFRFTVTDQNAIKELYDILSTAKIVNKKSPLQPDYIFEMDEGNNKIHRFNYIAGLDKKDLGNLYSDNKIYIVSKRIDNDIMENFWTIRKPKNFKQVYYGSIFNTLEQYLKGKSNNKTIGINVNDDIEAAKFILSTDLEDFKDELDSKFKNTYIASNGQQNYDITMTIKTQGYKSTLYKAIVTFWDRIQKSEDKYYIYDEYTNGRWNMNISQDKPKGF
jgi:predicted RND superfamily exporter protein